MKYSIYEDRTTYLLEIDQKKKTYSVGSIKGKLKRETPYVPIDITAYKNEISKIGIDYQCMSNNLSV